MKRLLRRLSAPLLGSVEAYRILRLDRARARPAAVDPAAVRLVSADGIRAAASEDLRGRDWYAGGQAAAYGWYEGAELVALCVYWWGERYAQRDFWPLAAGQAKLVEVFTAPGHRGRGIARQLIMASSARLFAEGFDTLYARVWHSNQPSLAAFDHAGWRRVALVVCCSPSWRRTAWRWTLGQAPDGRIAAS